MDRRGLLKTGVALGGALLAGRTARAAEVIKFKLGTVDPPSSHSGVGSEAFAAEVSRLSGGSMHVDVFHAGSLGSIPEQMKNVFSGAQDMHLLYPEFLSSFTEQGKLVSAPYLFRDQQHLQLYYRSALFKPAIDKLMGLGCILLDSDWTWMVKDPRGLLSVRAVITPADLKDMKIRLWEDKTAIETWRGLGGNPIVIPRPQVYLALKQGLIEAGPETIGLAYDSKDDEVAKFWSRTDEYFQILNIMMNQQRFNSLTDEQKQILRAAAAKGGAAIAAASAQNFIEKTQAARIDQQVTAIQPAPGPWQKKGAEVLEKLKQSGVVPKELADRAAALS